MAKFNLVKIRINNGGYDDRGRYWGTGKPLYQYESIEVLKDASAVGIRDISFPHGHIRANDRDDAKAQVLKKHPDATFYR